MACLQIKIKSWKYVERYWRRMTEEKIGKYLVANVISKHLAHLRIYIDDIVTFTIITASTWNRRNALRHWIKQMRYTHSCW